MKNIGFDKFLHAFVCLLVTAFTAMVLCATVTWFGGNAPMVACAAIGALFALMLGGAKEAIDFYEKRTFDFYDLLADLVGTVAGFLLALLI